MTKTKHLILLIFVFAYLLNAISFAQKITSDPKKKYKYLEKTLIIKVKEQYRNSCTVNSINSPVVSNLFSALGTNAIVKKFPAHLPPREKQNKLKQAYADLSLIFELKYQNNIELDKAIHILKSSGYFEYVEPHIVFDILSAQLIPNDPLISNQYYISDTSRLGLYKAWAINSGDTNVVVGITDTGCDITHPDLVNNIKRNYYDPINGVDDDMDGYTDNFNGWDTGSDDNNPMDVGVHGTHVSGIAGASTNNSYGIAGTGFNCKLLPVKVANNSGALTGAYEGIVYAADHGANIVNCSWGSPSGYNQFGQDIITYATINKNCLVVCAAGNNGNEDTFYPAAYEYALAVSNVQFNDSIVANTSYGYFVDVSAPGGGIYSTFPSNSYNYSSGTSMASPAVAGCAGIVKSHFPNYTAMQVGQKLKATSDNIYGVNNAYLQDKLGEGRINLYRALTENNAASFVSSQRLLTDYNDNYFESGDTLRFTARFINYLSPSNNAQVFLNIASPYTTIINNTVNLGSIATMDTTNNNSTPFLVKLSGIIPINTPLKLKLTYIDGTYIGFEVFEIILNPDYIDITINDVHTTATSKSLIGYNDNNQQKGLGFNYNNRGTLLYESGLMIGNSASKVSDNVRGDGIIDTDFSIQNIIHPQPSAISDFDLETIFNDNGAGAQKLKITVRQNTYAWQAAGHRKYIINRYTITNNDSNAISSLYAGIFSDWDIQNAAQNSANYDSGRKLGYCFSNSSSAIYAGVRVLDINTIAYCNSIDNTAGGAGGIDITNGFDTLEKYAALSTNKFQAGTSGQGTDVCQVVGSGPFYIAAGDSISVSFAILAGDNLADLQKTADSALAQYNVSFPLNTAQQTIVNEAAIFPNPVNESLHISLGNLLDATLEIYSGLGQLVYFEKISNNKTINVSALAAGIYFVRLKGDGKTLLNKKIIKN